MSLKPLAEVISQYGLQTKKSLGQHFLLDEFLLTEIAACSGDLSEVNVIEIGPGPGGLTRALLATSAKTVTAVEKDSRCMEALSELKLQYPQRFSLLEMDAMNVNISEITKKPRAIVANLPYNVGTELLLQWLELIYQEPDIFASLTLMFQKEVADRLLAKPNSKEYGRLSVYAQWLCKIEHIMDIAPEAFSPPPKVTSSLVRISPRKKPLFYVEKAQLENVLRVAFGKRRKMLRASLKEFCADIEERLNKQGINPENRPEQITLSDWEKVVMAIYSR